MRKSLFSIVTASALVSGAAMADTTTTTTWSNDQGSVIREYSTTKHYGSFSDPSLNPTVGMTLPSTVTVYPLPSTIQVPAPQTYSYSIINEHPVVIERGSRRVVHVW